jgi:hypothetical protein
MNMSIREYLGSVGKTLAKESTTQMLQFGTTARLRGQQMIRDDAGLTSTKSNILEVAQTFFAATRGRDELATAFANFSTGDLPTFGDSAVSTGQEAISGVKTVGAIDVTILSLSTSIIPFVAIDRSLPTPEATIYYNNLVAMNSAGGVEEGEIVSGNFLPPNSKVELSSEVSDKVVTSGTALEEGCKVVPGSVVVTVTKGDVDYVGQDFAQNGQIYFQVGAGVTAATVDYDTGKFEVTADGATIKLAYQKDFASTEVDGSGETGTLVVAPEWVPTTISTTRDSVIVQDNIVNRMAMQKVQMLATAGAGGESSADVMMARVKNTYIEVLNRKVLKTVIGQFVGKAEAMAAVDLDLRAYDLGAWANTKNDQVLQLMTNLDAHFLAHTGIQGTAIITSSYGVSMLQCIPNMWTPNPDAVTGLNGLAGYFNGKAVYRHNMIDTFVAKYAAKGDLAESNGIPFFMVAKLPDNNSGSCIFGEYLPLTSTGVVGNFNQPQNISNGFFSQTGAKLVDKNLVELAVVVPPNGLYKNNGDFKLAYKRA